MAVTFLDMMYVEFMKNFLLADSSELMAVRLISCLLSPKTFPTFLDMISTKTFDSYFLDMMYVEFMKNFLLVDSSE